MCVETERLLAFSGQISKCISDRLVKEGIRDEQPEAYDEGQMGVEAVLVAEGLAQLVERWRGEQPHM